jgi:hypothetical protein
MQSESWAKGETVSPGNLSNLIKTISPTPSRSDYRVTDMEMIWAAFEEPSLYGVCFPIVEGLHKEAVYFPYLSAIHASGDFVFIEDEPIACRAPLSIAGRKLSFPKSGMEVYWMSVLWLPASGDPDSMTDAFLAYYQFNPLSLSAFLPWNSFSPTWAYKPNATYAETQAFVDGQISRASALVQQCKRPHPDFLLFIAANSKV